MSVLVRLPVAENSRRRSGFSLIELLVVLLIVVLLTSLLMPGLRAVRETANKLSCAANLRQMGCALTVYATDHDDRLPYSFFGSAEIMLYSEMMALTTGSGLSTVNTFEGFGRLLPRAGRYLDCAGCMFCPSHRGEHSFERYEETLSNPLSTPERAFANYHYRGDVDPETGVRFRFSSDHSFLLAADGLRTKSDFNHGNGLNRLHGDLATTWLDDSDGSLLNSLPDVPSDAGLGGVTDLWEELIDTDE
jgi:prepilin-type N-terminal cleavage/methylation domain-containing protein